ncbi:MAG: phosphatase PAP2 family protein [Rubrivivax sp.]|nr:phosphatase PAP2 family protein [Rubrivivax sp.]
MTATTAAPADAADVAGTAPTATRLRRDLLNTTAALLALLAWDASGADLAAARLFGNLQGFAARDSAWASTLLHDGGRLGAWLLLALLAGAAWRAGPGGVALPGSAHRWRWLGVTLLGALAVPALKRLSATSCPWDLAEFGGVAQHVSHWAWGLADGGAGHCFPSGHAVAAFAFFTLHFQWREFNRRRARVWLVAVAATGALFGAAQLARGAHFPSHTLWSAWLCWVLCVAAAAAFRAREPKPS